MLSFFLKNTGAIRYHTKSLQGNERKSKIRTDKSTRGRGRGKNPISRTSSLQIPHRHRPQIILHLLIQCIRRRRDDAPHWRHVRATVPLRVGAHERRGCRPAGSIRSRLRALEQHVAQEAEHTREREVVRERRGDDSRVHSHAEDARIVTQLAVKGIGEEGVGELRYGWEKGMGK